MNRSLIRKSEKKRREEEMRTENKREREGELDREKLGGPIVAEL